jgi:hypothetical protein
MDIYKWIAFDGLELVTITDAKVTLCYITFFFSFGHHQKVAWRE